MTPQEQQLVADLFDRLASLEGQRRDPDAERLIREGLGRAPNAVYALVQSVLVQDEALKRANAHIEELQRAVGGAEPAQGGGGFLDSMRNVIMGRDQSRGSVPSVRPGGQGSSGVWGTRPEPSQHDGPPQQGYPQQGYPQQAGYPGAPMGGGMMGGGMMPGMGGGSFLGTAAATVAGVVGGAMLLNGIRGMMGGGHQSLAGDLDRGTGSHAASSPWDGGGDRGGSGDLSRDAGLNDIGGGGHRAAAYDDSSRSSLLGGNDDPAVDQPDDDSFDVGDSGDGGGDSDTV
jgi:hypothetical protein